VEKEEEEKEERKRSTKKKKLKRRKTKRKRRIRRGSGRRRERRNKRGGGGGRERAKGFNLKKKTQVFGKASEKNARRNKIKFCGKFNYILRSFCNNTARADVTYTP
jgi:hypothetical protein